MIVFEVRRVLSLTTVVAALAITACGSSSNTTSSSSSSSSSSATSSAATGGAAGGAGHARTVVIKNFKFVPASITVKPGTKITFRNEDSTDHTVTADKGNAFDTGSFGQGQTKTVTLTKPGSYAYHCSIHPFMHGAIVVK
jgi:plastocyanin